MNSFIGSQSKHCRSCYSGVSGLSIFLLCLLKGTVIFFSSGRVCVWYCFARDGSFLTRITLVADISLTYCWVGQFRASWAFFYYSSWAAVFESLRLNVLCFESESYSSVDYFPIFTKIRYPIFSARFPGLRSPANRTIGRRGSGFTGWPV